MLQLSQNMCSEVRDLQFLLYHPVSHLNLIGIALFLVNMRNFSQIQKNEVIISSINRVSLM